MKKIILLSAAFVFYFSSSFSQEIEWQNTIGGNHKDEVNSIEQTSDGGFIFGGYSYSDISGDKTENCIGSQDYWIVKTDAFLNIQWQNTIGGTYSEELHSIRQTSDHGYILGGWSLSNVSGDKTENYIGHVDYWIVKLDSMGNVLWDKTIGGSSADYLNIILQTIDGGYILGGYSISNISGYKIENSMGGFDYWIVKIDGMGNIQWQNTIGGSNDDELQTIQQTNDGGYILGGYSQSYATGDKTENSNGAKDYWIVKTDSLGNIVWQNTIGGNNDDFLHSIQQTTDGGYILGGSSDSQISGDKMNNCIGYWDYWIVKTDDSGNIMWQKTIGGIEGDALSCLKQTTEGGYILGGGSDSPISGNKTENNYGEVDYWIVKTDSMGIIQFQKTIGASSGDYINSIQQTIDGGYIFGGCSYSNTSGDKNENCIGWADYWIVKLTDECNTIIGKLFIDANSNNVQDIGEPNVINTKVIESNTGRFAFSSQSGNYSVSVLDSGNFTVSANAMMSRLFQAMFLLHL